MVSGIQDQNQSRKDRNEEEERKNMVILETSGIKMTKYTGHGEWGYIIEEG